MEGFIIDKISVERNMVAVEVIGKNSDILAFEALKDYNIESAVYSKPRDCTTVIIRKPDGASGVSFAETLGGQLRAKCGDDLQIGRRSDFVFLTIHGLFLGGKDGPITEITSLLSKKGINIEYQVLNPSSYSVMIASRAAMRAVKSVCKYLKVRDSSVVFR